MSTSGEFRPLNDASYKRKRAQDQEDRPVISVNPTIQNAYAQIIRENENKVYDDNGDLVNLNPDDEFYMYEGEDRYKAYNIEREGGFNEWRDKEFPWDEQIREINQKVFKNQTFLENQREVINAALSGRDVMALIPTGGGKSLTFQLTALMNNGYTFVVMPLISLIEDQIESLRRLRIKCVQFSSRFAKKERKQQFYTDLVTQSDPYMKLIYLTPEKLV